MDVIVSEEANAKARRSMADLPDKAGGKLLDPGKQSHDADAEKQRALDRQIDAWNAFHEKYGLLSDELDLY